MKTMGRGYSRAWTILSAALVLALPAIAAGQLMRVGAEFQVNSYTRSLESNGYGPRLGTAADGSFIVSWQDDEDDSVSARRFDSSGSPVGAQFLVAPVSSYRPTLAVVPDGRFVVAWEAPDGDTYGITAQRFSSAGSALGSEVQVNSYITEYQGTPFAASDGAGNVLMVWESGFQDGNRRGVFAQRFDSAGAFAGTEFQVNGYTFGSQAGPVVAGDPAGGFVVVWSDYRYNGFVSSLIARRYDSSGNLRGTEFQINSYTSSIIYEVALSIGPDGGFVAAFSCSDRDGDSTGVFARRFDSSGAPVGSEFQVNTNTLERQLDPAVAHDENGGFAVVWASDQGENVLDVVGKRYDSAGTARGGEFQVSTYTFFNQNYPRIASLADGEFVVVWSDEHQDGYFTGVFGTRLAPVGRAVGGNKLIIKNPPSGPAGNQLVLLSKDAAIATPDSVVGDPRCAPLGSGTPSSGARLSVRGPGGDLAIDLPCVGWVANANRTKFTYRDASGATCKRVTLIDGRVLKAVCTGPQVAYALGAAQDAVQVALSTGNATSAREHCMLFSPTGADVTSDGSNGRLYRARAASAPNFCP